MLPAEVFQNGHVELEGPKHVKLLDGKQFRCKIESQSRHCAENEI
jgi:hypothetical protein